MSNWFSDFSTAVLQIAGQTFFAWSDVALVVIVAFFLFLGFRKGFVRTIIRLGSSILSFVVALFLYPLVSAFLKTTPLLSWVSQAISPIISSHMQSSIGNVPTVSIDFSLNKMGYAGFIQDWITQGITETSKLFNWDIVLQKISVGIAGIVIDVFALLLVYIIVKFGLYFIRALLTNIAKLPVIKQVDKLAGGIVGLINGILMVYLIAALVFLASSVTPMPEVKKDINASSLAKYMYTNNFIVNLIAPKTN